MFGVAFLLLHCSLRVGYAALLLLCTASTYRFANSTSTLTVMAHIQSHHHTCKQGNSCGHYRNDKQLIWVQVGSEWPGSQNRATNLRPHSHYIQYHKPAALSLLLLYPYSSFFVSLCIVCSCSFSEFFAIWSIVRNWRGQRVLYKNCRRSNRLSSGE